MSYFEVRMSVDESLDLFDSVHNENVNQVFAGAVQPVVERSSPLGEFQVQNIDLLQDTFGVVQRLTAALGESAKTVPLVADALATGIYADAVVIVQSAEKLIR